MLRRFERELGRNFDHVVVVGDGENDICLLRASDSGVAFQPKSENVQAAASHTISKDLQEILALLPARRASSTEDLMEDLGMEYPEIPIRDFSRLDLFFRQDGEEDRSN